MNINEKENNYKRAMALIRKLTSYKRLSSFCEDKHISIKRGICEAAFDYIENKEKEMGKINVGDMKLSIFTRIKILAIALNESETTHLNIAIEEWMEKKTEATL